MAAFDPGDDWHPSIPTDIPSAPSVDIDFDSLEGLERIGSGGNADVYRATVTQDGVTHDIAINQPRFDSTMHIETLDRFSSEAETWDKLDDHPHIVGVIDWGIEPVPWLGMEYMDGGHLGHRRLPLDLSEALWLGQSLCRAVRHAHRRGVAHLDLKPANVLFRETGPDRWSAPKIGDWGLSKLLLEHSSTVTGYSPSYAAPEQVDPDTYGGADDFTDIYQVGAVLYEALVGDPPFSGSQPAVIRAILEETPVAPSDRNRDLPETIDSIVLSALAKDKQDRPASIIHLREALDAVIGDRGETDSSQPKHAIIGAATRTGIPSGEPERKGDPTEEASITNSRIDRRRILTAVGSALVLGGTAYALARSGPTPTDSTTDGIPNDTGLAEPTTPTATVSPTPSGGVVTDTEGATTPPGPATPTPRTLKLGILTAETGQLGWIGPSIRDAALLVAKHLNETGGPFSVDVQVEDTASDPDTGAVAAQRLVNRGYPMFVGALSSTVTLAIAREVAIEQELVGCSPGSTGPSISSLDDNDYIFRTIPADEFYGLVMAKVGWDRLNARSAAVLAENTWYGDVLANNFAKGWNERDGELVGQTAYEPGRTTYGDVLQDALGSSPEVLMIAGRSESGTRILADFYAEYSQEFCEIIVSDGLKDASLPDRVDNSMRNVWGLAPVAAGPGKDYFDQQYETEYGSEPDSEFLAYAFDAAAVLCLANAAAGENVGATIRESMRSIANQPGEMITPETLDAGLSMAASGEPIDYHGASGPLTFDDSGDMTEGFYELFRFTREGIDHVDLIDFDL